MFGNPSIPCCAGGSSELWWPSGLPSANLDYSLGVNCEIPDTDVIVQVQVSIAPSGSGELQALDLAVTGEIIVVQLTGGQPCRLYRIMVATTTSSGRVYPSVVYKLCSSQAALPPPPDPPPVPGFGTPITWASGATVFGPAIAAVANGIVATGTNQATAFPLQAQTNIVASFPTGTGVILNAAIVSGTLVVQNMDPVNDGFVYPPSGAQINSLGTDVPFVIGPDGARISFSTQSSGTQWEAG